MKSGEDVRSDPTATAERVASIGRQASVYEEEWLGQVRGWIEAPRYRQVVEVTRSQSYPIVIEPGLLDNWIEETSALLPGRGVAWIVADEAAWMEHGERFLAVPGSASVVREVLTLPMAESAKSVASWSRLIDWLSERKAERRDTLVVFGGSALSDLIGFVAATYMRGIPYLNVPTTLLAQVDGSMGGKVAVNTARAKNLVGAFHHPIAVLSDPHVLRTLPRAEIASGMAEVIKTLALKSEVAFAFLEDHLDRCMQGEESSLAAIVRLCASIKTNLLAPDPFEDDLRRLLNFGHTVGHAIETARSYSGIRHGEAVAVGMATATRIGLARGLTSATAADRLLETIRQAELSVGVDESTVDDVLACLDIIGAIRGGSFRFVIPREIGRFAIVDDVSMSEIANALPASPSL